jgi:hypothetical protein
MEKIKPLRTRTVRSVWSTLLKGASTVTLSSGMVSHRGSSPRSIEQSLRDDWVKVGGDMRAAIKRAQSA